MSAAPRRQLGLFVTAAIVIANMIGTGIFTSTGFQAASMPFCAMLQVSDADRFAKRRKLPFWIDGMLRDAGASYLHGLPRTPTAETELADPLRVLEAADSAFERPLPPFFAPVGTRDPLLDDTRRLEKALRLLNVPVEARYYPGGIHAFHAMVWDPAARRCWRDALAFLDRYMR